MSKNRSFVVGATVHLASEWRVAGTGTLTTPGTPVLTVKPPTGDNVTPNVTTDSTGMLSVDYVVSLAGYYKYKWNGASPAAGIKEGSFYVAESSLV